MTNTHSIAVITGASSGIGAATALALADIGWRVVLVARRADRLEELSASIQDDGGESMIEALDASDGNAVDAMADRVRAAWGAPSLVVNSAGAGIWRFLEETTATEIDSMIGAPFLAAAQTSRAFIGDMIGAGRGLLIHIGSPASVIPWPGATAYTASRWALRGLQEALRQDLGGTGVTSSLVYFGEVSSEYFEANPGSHEHIPSLGSWIPASTPERCAEVILGVVRHPRPVVYHPFALRLMAWTGAVLPGPTRWLIAKTGRRHELNREDAKDAKPSHEQNGRRGHRVNSMGEVATTDAPKRGLTTKRKSLPRWPDILPVNFRQLYDCDALRTLRLGGFSRVHRLR